MECLANVLNQKHPRFNTISPEQPLRDALNQMSCEKKDYLVVLDEADFVGILSEQDVTQKLFTNNKPIDDLQVKDIMNRTIPVGSINDGIEYAMQMLNRYNSRYIAVFDQLEFKGIISESDLLKKTLEKQKWSKEEQPFTEVYNWSY